MAEIYDTLVSIVINMEYGLIYLITIAFIALIWMIYVGSNIEKMRKKLDMYDRYFKAAGIVITRDDIEQMLRTKKTPVPTCAPGGPEDRLR